MVEPRIVILYYRSVFWRSRPLPMLLPFNNGPPECHPQPAPTIPIAMPTSIPLWAFHAPMCPACPVCPASNGLLECHLLLAPTFPIAMPTSIPLWALLVPICPACPVCPAFSGPLVSVQLNAPTFHFVKKLVKFDGKFLYSIQ